MRKRIFAFVLSIVMLLSVTPMNMLYAIGEDYLDNDSLYSALLAAQTVEEFSALLENNLPDEDAEQAFLTAFDDEEMDKLVEKAEELKEDYLANYPEIEYDGEPVTGQVAFANEGVNYTDAAPLVKPPVKKKLMAKAPANPPKNNVEGLEIAKTVTKKTDGVYTITLEVYTTGEVKTEVKSVPTDIVLVLDQSGSMENTYKSITTATFDQIEFVEDTIWVPIVGNIGTGTYSPKNLGVATGGNLYYKLNNGIFTRVEVNYWWGTYYYTWTDETGDEKTVEAGGSLLDAPSELRGNVYRMRTATTDISRLEALQDAATTFVSNVQDDAVENGVDHRIAVVGFASNGTTYNSSRWENTELLSTQNVVGYTAINNSDYTNALVSANVNGSVNPRLTTALGRLDAEGGTYINNGIEMAQGIFNNTDGTGRNRVVVILTDGTPGDGSWGNSVKGNSCASDAITRAKALKDAGVTVYTIGIFDGADATSAGSNTGSTNAKNNYFMQQLSSNNGTPKTPSYYMSADNPEALNNIFQSISEQIGIPKIDLGSETVVKDFMTPYFEIPEGTEVKLFTAACNGGDEENGFTFADRIAYTPGEEDVTLTDDDGVLVTGFDFSANFCAKVSETEYRGKKLIIEFDAAAKDGVIIPDTELVYDEETGTYMVPTNLDKSGVYTDEQEEEAVEPFLPFEIPETVTYAVNTKHVIFNADGTIKSTTDIIDTLYGLPGKNVEISVDGDEYDDYRFDGWYSDAACGTEALLSKELTYSAKASSDGVTYYAKFVLDEAPYKVRHYLQNANGDGYTLKTTNEYDLSGAPYVGIIGQLTTKADAHPRTETGYEHYTAVTPIVQQTIAADGSTYVDIYYKLDTYTITYVVDGETEETATYKFGQNVADYQAVAKTNYDFHGWYTGSDYKTGWTKPATMPAENITVYGYHTRKLGTLTVSKSGMSEGETAIFTITGGNLGDTGIKIAVSNGGSVTIKDLYVGETYTVTEDSGWTWRYTADASIKTQTISESQMNPEVTFKNSKTNNRWLDAFSIIRNVFTGSVPGTAD